MFCVFCMCVCVCVVLCSRFQIFYVLGLPVLNYLVVVRLHSNNDFLARSTREKAEYGFGALFGFYREELRIGAVFFMVRTHA